MMNEAQPTIIMRFYVSCFFIPDLWVPNEVNDGHMEYFCFMCAVLMFCNFIVYIFVARKYHYNDQRMNNNYRVAYSAYGASESGKVEISDGIK